MTIDRQQKPQLKETFDKLNPREWVVFRGKTFENGEFQLQGSWKIIESNIRKFKEKHGKNGLTVLKRLVEASKSCELKEISADLKQGADPVYILNELEQLKIVVVSYIGDKYQEWKYWKRRLRLFTQSLE